MLGFSTDNAHTQVHTHFSQCLQFYLETEVFSGLVGIVTF